MTISPHLRQRVQRLGRHLAAFAAGACVPFALGSCALFSKADIPPVAWFTPEPGHAPERTGVVANGPALRFGRVYGGADLGRRIVYGDGAYQVAFYEDRRWTERPDVYIRQALNRALFEEHGFVRELSGNAPTLDAEVLVFEEVSTPEVHAARIVIRVVLSTDRVLFEDRVVTQEPVIGYRFDDVVAAMGRALDASAAEVATRVGAALTKPVSLER
jgi:cholesterol transport system auxiliary component